MMATAAIYAVLLICICNTFTAAISTIHHDKPNSVTISTIKITESSTDEALRSINVTLSSSERKKRLLPYQNFYFNQPFNRPHKAGVSAQQFKDFEDARKSPKKQQEGHFRSPDILYQPSQKFTPFLETNAIPGPFRPMINPNLHYVLAESAPPEQENNANAREQPPQQDLRAIYEKLAQLKLRQQAMHQKNPPYGYRLVPQYRFRERPQKLPPQEFDYEAPRYKVQPTKTTIETFTATNIDIPVREEEAGKYEQVEPPRYLHQIPTPIIEQTPTPIHTPYRERVKPFVQHQIAIDVPQSSFSIPFTPDVGRKPSNTPKQRPKAYIVIQQNRPKQQGLVVSRKPSKPATIVEENYVAEKFIPLVFTKVQHYQTQRPAYQTPISYQGSYEIQHQATPAPEEVPQQYQDYYQYHTGTPAAISTAAPPASLASTEKVQYETDYSVASNPPDEGKQEKTTSLAELLKHLQESNALPQTLTPDNIDNSIKTLVRILNDLKDRQKVHQPVMAQDEYEYDNEAGVDLGGEVADTPDGGTPGKPGVDYPALSNIPKTTFSCKTQRYKGFFGDPDTNCQVWHYCDLNGGQASFLCPNGTIFSQVALTCDWWYNVKCASTAQLYVLNERLYKYIIPLSPKFPEDYSGPLVDKYLAMKFQEMEEKLRKQKKGKGNSDSGETTEANEEVEEEEEGASSNEESRLLSETEKIANNRNSDAESETTTETSISKS
ncbi:uncharacterized protein [Euwallacea similis]|uniref:uncharacterized protein isoform X2 n=1 Tax=Euwallacea similis TaxID=1736056 RepID=UPI00344F3311